MHNMEERKRNWKSILAGEGDIGAEKSPGALDPARRDSWSEMDSRVMNSLDEKEKMTWEEIYGQATWRP